MNETRELALNGSEVCIGYIPAAPTLKSTVSNGGRISKVNHGIAGHCFHLSGNTSTESHASPNKEHQYQQAPEYTEGRH